MNLLRLSHGHKNSEYYFRLGQPELSETAKQQFEAWVQFFYSL